MSQLAQRLFMASGGGKKTATYVDDVFSTHLYDGNANTSIVINNGIKLGNANAGSSVYFGDYGSLVVPTSADFKFGTGAFTIEFFIYFIYSTDYISIFDGRPVGTNGNQTTMNMYGGGQLNWYDLTNNTAVISNSGSTALPTNAWTHVAYVREGTGTNQAKMYFNGSLVGTGTDPQDYAVNQLNRIGGQPWSPGIGNFYISNYRVVKGTAVYTSNFTTPTAPLTDISGTVLLCCQSSTDPFAATVTPGTITIGAQTNARTPRAVPFGTETANDGAGGMVWVKSIQSENHALGDTVRGTGKVLLSNSTAGNSSIAQSYLSFNNGGFTVGDDWIVNRTNLYDYASWTFRKQKGFFDIVTWSGNNTAGRTIPHNLGSIPGCIMVKRTDTSDSWQVYHRGNVTGDQNAAHYWLNLDQATPKTNSDTRWNDTEPTASVFTVGADAGVNTSGGEYIAYLFAGGDSTAATARSVYFGGDSWLIIPSSSDLTLGTGDFTIETWVYPESFGNRSTIYDGRSSGGTTGITIGWEQTSGQVRVYMNASNGSDIVVQSDDLENQQWSHIAVTRSSGTVRLFINGIEKDSATRTSDLNNTNAKNIGYRSYTSSSFDYLHGQLSNFRLVKGTAVYTSSFIPLTEPLTNITNTKLLCCQNSTVTGATVTPGTITSDYAAGGPTIEVRTSSPFDDIEGYKFGADGDQNIIKCGYYTGNANDDGPLVDVGFESQWIMIKNTSANESWHMMDCMRGIVTRRGASNSNTGNDAKLWANSSAAGNSLNDSISLTPRGFKVVNSNGDLNGNGQRMIYIAIRRPDGYVGKPVEVGTDVFDIDLAGINAGDPSWESSFPVDMEFIRDRNGSTYKWFLSTRLTQGNYLSTSESDTETSNAVYSFDYNNGWGNYSSSDAELITSWMWKRYSGFDVVAYTGNGVGGVGRQISHSMNRAPQMIMTKARSASYEWPVWHVGLSAIGNNLRLNGNYAELSANNNIYGGTGNALPTTTHWTVGSHSLVNANGENYISLLFASVEGVSKVGSYAGSNSTLPIPCGFQPRFLIIKNITDARNWTVLDTTRGWGAGNDCRLFMDLDESQICTSDVGAPTSTGFTLTTGNQRWNIAGDTYIYYAHA